MATRLVSLTDTDRCIVLSIASRLGRAPWAYHLSISKEMTVAFWSDKTVRAKGESLVQPYRPERVKHGAYELGVGGEAYITSEALPRATSITRADGRQPKWSIGRPSELHPDCPSTPPGNSYHCSSLY
jgi:hypothetical protein